MYSLSISRNQQPVEELVLRQDTITIGRSKQNDVQLADTTVSQLHARLIVDTDSLVIEDLHSTNGTYVNGQRITKQKLDSGDEIMIGQHKLSCDRLFQSDEALEAEPTLQMSREAIEQFLNSEQSVPATATEASDDKAIKWVAQDRNGVWWGFHQQPVASSSGWSNFQDTMKLRLKQEPPNPEWRDTLHKI